MTGGQIQRDLFDYLSIELDPYDFSAYLQEWFEVTGDPRAAEDDIYVDALTDAERRVFARWLRETDKVGHWLQNDPVDSPAYLTLHARAKLPKGTWLAHFTRSGGFRAFDRGTDLRGLHLSTWKTKKDPVDCKKNLKASLFEAIFGFAFEAESRFVHQNIRRNGTRYGDYVLLFKSDFAVLADHDGDEEDQVIFPLCSEYDVAGFSIDGGLLGETVNGDERLFDSAAEAIEYMENRRSPRLRGYA